MLNIDTAKVCRLIYMARQYFAKGPEEPDLEGSNPSDDDFRGVLALDEPVPAGDPVDRQMASLIAGLNDDEMDALLALTWIGRGDFGMDEWDAVVERASGATDERRPEYFLEIPLLADYLEDSLAQMGISCQELRENPPLESVP